MSLETVRTTLDKGVTAIENFFLLLASAALVLIMVLVSYSAVSRYLFSNPVSGSQTWVSAVLAPAVTFLALSGALRARRHIGVAFIVTKMSPGFRLATQTIAGLVTAGIFLLVAYEGAIRTQTAVSSSLMEPELGIPLAPILALVPICGVLIAVRALLICWQWWAGDRSDVSLVGADEGGDVDLSNLGKEA